MIITFFVGILLSTICQVGSDVMALISYIVSEDNFGEGKDNLFVDQLEETKDYLYTCINVNGDILNKLGISTESLGSFDALKDAEAKLDELMNKFQYIKDNKVACPQGKNALEDRIDLEVEGDFGFIIQNPQEVYDPGKGVISDLKFKQILSNINNDDVTRGKEEEWIETCEENNACNSHQICYLLH